MKSMMTLAAVAAWMAVAGAAETKKPEIVDGTHGYYAENYVEPTDPLVKAEIEKFRDRKLALMIHFGVYTQLGIHESQPLVDGAARRSRSLVDWNEGEPFKKEYLNLWKSFNPVRFQPERWAALAVVRSLA